MFVISHVELSRTLILQQLELDSLREELAALKAANSSLDQNQKEEALTLSQIGSATVSRKDAIKAALKDRPIVHVKVG